MPKYAPILARLGDSWTVPVDLSDDLDEFTCALYGRPRMKRVDDIRFQKMKEFCTKDDLTVPSKNFDMGTIPPCRKSLEQHIRRVNYQLGIYKQAHIPNPDIPKPTDGHGWTMIDGKLEPLWFDGDVLPRQLVDIAETVISSDDDSDSDVSLPDSSEYFANYSSDSEFE